MTHTHIVVVRTKNDQQEFASAGRITRDYLRKVDVFYPTDWSQNQLAKLRIRLTANEFILENSDGGVITPVHQFVPATKPAVPQRFPGLAAYTSHYNGRHFKGFG